MRGSCDETSLEHPNYRQPTRQKNPESFDQNRIRFRFDLLDLATFTISSESDRLRSASVKDRSSAIAAAITSSRSLTSASSRSVAFAYEIVKIALDFDH